MSKFYYRMYKKIKTIALSHGKTKSGKNISGEKLYKLYSKYGKDDKKGNFITYNERCEKEFKDLDKYFIDNYAYFIKSDNDILGFVLIDDNRNNNYEISEIFVLNNYKRNKIGKESVTKVFNLHRGNWTIKAVPNSIIAESFWKNIVKEYTNNNYIEEYTGKYNRLEIYFSNGN